MENYQMFFPCSSSSSMAVSAAYPAVSSNMESSQLAYSGFNIGDINHDHRHLHPSSNGFLGLRTENNHVIMRNNQDNQAMMMINKAHMNNNISIVNGGADDHQGKSNSSGVKKKGETKKVRKPKFAFQTRSQVDILDDGYRWRKYGQKAVKNNKFPRSYYRCTHQGCNVKKQVQRLTKDEGIVVTTYEGMHTHPIEKHTDNFEHILNQMHIYTPF